MSSEKNTPLLVSQILKNYSIKCMVVYLQNMLRLIRLAQSRKCNQVDNLTDCTNRLWVRSDIKVRNAVAPKKTITNVHVHPKDTSRCYLPFPSLADYYLNELITDN